ncbi:MAG: AAA family ATPase [Patescibacteria group bacterium]|jgi:DNA polymerase-3 subunit delta'|nr:AAA family ATPase [bacterium]
MSEPVWPKIGNEKNVEFLNRVVLSKKPAQTYIFLGPDDLGKSTIALAFARNLMAEALEGKDGLNSDLHILEAEAEKKSISIEQTRELIKALSLSSFLDSYKIGIIKEADSLTTEAQNALLKTLEEPREKVILILIAENEEALLPTILSRAQKLYFQPVKAETIYDFLISEYQAQRSLAKDLANLSLGRPLKAVRFLENADLYANYLEKATLFLTLFPLGINSRLEVLDKIFIDKTYSATATKGAQEILSMVEGLLRDLLLIHFNQPEKIQHSALKIELDTATKEIEKIIGPEKEQDNFTLFILERFKLSAMAREYISANVNPRLVLEQLIINL